MKEKKFLDPKPFPGSYVRLGDLVVEPHPDDFLKIFIEYVQGSPVVVVQIVDPEKNSLRTSN